MADCNVQETCSLMIFLSLRRIANPRTAVPLPRTPFSAMGAINHVNVFMNNKLIRFRTSCTYICAEACNPGSTQFNPLSTEPGSTRVVVRHGFRGTHTCYVHSILLFSVQSLFTCFRGFNACFTHSSCGMQMIP